MTDVKKPNPSDRTSTAVRRGLHMVVKNGKIEWRAKSSLIGGGQ